MSTSRASSPAFKIGKLVFMLLVALAILWSKGRLPLGDTPKSDPSLTASPSQGEAAQDSGDEVLLVNGYDHLRDCRLVEHRNNDGDSFHVRHGNRELELRLYFVDAPEKYLSDRYENQRKRVAEQAQELGGLSVDQTVKLGQTAKAHTLGLLEGESFEIFTRWEEVYDGPRVYGFVKLPGNEKFLSENLIEQGLARIHTKGATHPDGRSRSAYEAHLESLERQAKAQKRGAWGK